MAEGLFVYWSWSPAPLLGRSGGEELAFASGLRLGFRFGRLLRFLAAFIFVSHASRMPQTRPVKEEGKRRERRQPLRAKTQSLWPSRAGRLHKDLLRRIDLDAGQGQLELQASHLRLALEGRREIQIVLVVESAPQILEIGAK